MISRTLRALLRGLALALYGVLALLEGIVCPLLAGLAILIALSAFVFEYGSRVPKFPFWTVLGASFGCVLTMVLYYALMRFLRSASTT